MSYIRNYENIFNQSVNVEYLYSVQKLRHREYVTIATLIQTSTSIRFFVLLQSMVYVQIFHSKQWVWTFFWLILSKRSLIKKALWTVNKRLTLRHSSSVHRKCTVKLTNWLNRMRFMWAHRFHYHRSCWSYEHYKWV